MAFFVPPAQAVIHKVSIRSMIIVVISLTAYSYHGGIINQNNFFHDHYHTVHESDLLYFLNITGTEPSLPVLDPHRTGNIYISMGMMDTLQRYMMNQLSVFVLKKHKTFKRIIKGPEHWTSGVGSQHCFTPSSSPWSQSVIMMMMTINIVITIMLIKRHIKIC